MRVAHINKGETPEDDWRNEIIAYQKIIKEHPTNANAYDRMMILYRKLGDYEKELKIINTAIKAFEEIFQKREPVYNKKVSLLSKKLLKATGLADNKGNNIYQMGELSRWKRRKLVVIKRLGKK